MSLGLWSILLCLPAAEPVGKSPSELSMEERIPIAALQHWAFQPVKRPLLPLVRNREGVRNPIDAFVLNRLEQRGWTPVASASPQALLRRAYLDLTGLPPTTAELEAFDRDRSPDRWNRLVDDLLSRPTYGERWARHWLDLVRYADSNGYERDAEKPFVWRYRDYVISAFNEDRPYDRFVTEQLAGDELEDASSLSVLATGFLRLGHWDDEPADPAMDRYDQLDDMVSTSGQAFLGLTIGCARCHDHKFEPLTSQDYYQLVSVFAPLQRPQDGRTELTLPAGSRAAVAALAQRDSEIRELRQKTNVLSAAELESRIQSLKHRCPDLPSGYFMKDTGPHSGTTHVLLRGNPGRPGDAVQPGIPRVLSRVKWESGSGSGPTSQRRLALARWITRPEHPLTARVWVNRVWQQHFGQGLVRTPSDFGIMGEPPTHPELLDWLADWFVHEAGWSTKALHRLILTSATWQRSHTHIEDYALKDPENRLLWHQSYRRLEVEAVRDAILAASGELNRQRFGRGVFLPIPAAAVEANTDRDSIWKVSSPEETSRRTIYAFVKRGLVVPLLEVLDLCDTVSSSSRRQVTTIAPQALTLFNGDFVQEQSRRMADRLRREAGADVRRQIDLGCRWTLGRPASVDELRMYGQFLTEVADSGEEGLVQYCRILFNLNEFVYPE